MPPHSQCLPNGMPSTSGPSCGPINGGSSILNNHQNQLGPGISPHPGHMNGLGGPGMLPNGPSGTPHLPIPTPPIHTSNPNSILGGGPNGPHQLPSTMLGGPGNSNNGVGGLPPLPSMSSGKIRHIFLGIRIDAKAIIQKQYHIQKSGLFELYNNSSLQLHRHQYPGCYHNPPFNHQLLFHPRNWPHYHQCQLL